MTKVYHRSQRDDWGTPRNLVKWLVDNSFIPSIGLDAAADEQNKVVDNFIDESQDALKTPWRCPKGHCVWLNPPYSMNAAFIERAREQSCLLNVSVYALVPSRTDTLWWHKWVLPYARSVRYIKGRITFVGAESGAPFPSAIIGFDGTKKPGVQFHGGLSIPPKFRKDT